MTAESTATTEPTTTTEPTWHRSTCILCESNCGIEIRVEPDGRFSRIKGNKDHVASKGYTCEKALRLDHYQNQNGRLTSPLRRRPDGTYEEVDWDTAISEVAGRLAAIRDEHGGDKIFTYGQGGQGNHLGGTYGRALHAALGVRYRSNPLAQEKSGQSYVEARLYHAHTVGDIEHTEVAIFVGKNPWFSHGFPEARRVLKEIANDPNRSMIVLDPRRTKTAELADYHLAVRPGTDAFCIAAILAIMLRDDHVDRDFLRDHVADAGPVLDVIGEVPIDDYAERCGISVPELEAVARRLGQAQSCTVYEDLGIEQAPHSTLVSYLQRMIWILQGSFAKVGGMAPHTTLTALGGGGSGERRERLAPVTGTPIIAGLIQCNAIANEILTDHPNRFRAMIIDSSNPAHSIADSARFREAMDALEFTVVIDVAATETTRRADYVLPASSQFEKPECVFFTHEFPENVFTLRKPLRPPLDGTLPEPEIYTRLVEALGVYDDDDLAPLTEAANAGRHQYAAAFMEAAFAKPVLAAVGGCVLYRTLGPTLPPGMAGAASLWFLAQTTANNYPDAIERAGFTPGDHGTAGDALFDAMLERDDGVIFTRHLTDEAWDLTSVKDDRKIRIQIGDLLDAFRDLPDAPRGYTTDRFPFVLSAGDRRSFTANTIMRDPDWRKTDRHGALAVSVADADSLGLVDGDRVKLVTRAGETEAEVVVDDKMQAGHLSLPNGLGLSYPDDDGEHHIVGVALNELTEVGWEDEIALTPWHKHVPARIEKLGA
ncbi:MAG: molybdopterin-dependent oxidoreductase [Actinomycetota bacterium]